MIKAIAQLPKRAVLAGARRINIWKVNRRIRHEPIDPRITYPCYKSFDEFIDVERLQSLDAGVTAAIQEIDRTDKHSAFDSGTLKLSWVTRRQPGARVIDLRCSREAWNFLDFDKPEKWQRSELADRFEPLMEFIAELPFKALSRAIIIYDTTGKAATAHRDHIIPDLCHEFMWFRTNLKKPFYVFDERTHTKRHVRSYSAWFDTRNQFHGVDAHSGITFSMRVDGIFSDELRAQIPVPDSNLSATPSLWANLAGEAGSAAGR